MDTHALRIPPTALPARKLATCPMSCRPRNPTFEGHTPLHIPNSIRAPPLFMIVLDVSGRWEDWEESSSRNKFAFVGHAKGLGGPH